MAIWWLCWHGTILIRNITQKPYSQFPPVHDFGTPWWGVAYVPCMTNLRALCAWVIRWHVTCMLSLAKHWQGRRALSNHVCAHSVISMWHVVCLQHLARACSEQSRSTTVLPINHVIQMTQCLSGFVNHDYWIVIVQNAVSQIVIFVVIALKLILYIYQTCILSCVMHFMVTECPSEWVIKLNGLSWDSGHRGPYSPYKPCNHSLYIGIIILPQIDNTQFVGHSWL